MQLTDSPSRLYLLSSPVDFDLEVGGKKLEAKFLSGSFLDGIGYRLHFMFNDGHSDSYELDNLTVYNSAGEIDTYCNALKSEIYKPLWSWNPETEVLVIKYPQKTNVWIIQNRNSDSGKVYYSVYSQNEYKFSAEKRPVGWLVTSTEGTTIDEKLLELVKSAIKYHYQES